MRAIVRNLVLATIVFAAGGLADTHTEIVDLFASMASALSDDNAAGFMKGVDKNMPDYDKLEGSIDALIREAELSSSVDPVKDDGDETKRSVDLDWILDIRSRQMSGPLVRRQQNIHVELVKDKKRWRIVSIAPLDFFAPAKLSQSK